MPQSWKDLPGSKLADGNGLFWKKNDFYHMRIMDGNPNADWPSQQVKYTRFFKNGSYLDINGNPIHSNNQNFEELTHLPLSSITDDFLDSFFN